MSSSNEKFVSTNTNNDPDRQLDAYIYFIFICKIFDKIMTQGSVWTVYSPFVLKSWILEYFE